MYILPQERPQGVNFRPYLMKHYDGTVYQVLDIQPLCIKCKHSEVNISYPKDEMDCRKTGGICNALCTCDGFEEDC